MLHSLLVSSDVIFTFTIIWSNFKKRKKKCHAFILYNMMTIWREKTTFIQFHFIFTNTRLKVSKIIFWHVYNRIKHFFLLFYFGPNAMIGFFFCCFFVFLVSRHPEKIYMHVLILRPLPLLISIRMWREFDSI